MRTRALSVLASLSTLSALTAQDALADEPGASVTALEEIVVTARKREENLQKVPDALTVFTSRAIEDAGIQRIGDFFALTPNLTFQDGSAFSPTFFNLSMRGIGNAQSGWPSVAYIVDGVPADSLDSINSGSLEDIERIEVLRGPQSALRWCNQRNHEAADRCVGGER